MAIKQTRPLQPVDIELEIQADTEWKQTVSFKEDEQNFF